MSSASAEIVNPVPADANGLADVLSFIEAHEARHGTSPEPAFFLSGAGEHDRLDDFDPTRPSFPTEELSGHTGGDQAAEILSLSRPTVVGLIENGDLHAHVPGAVRRKLRLADVLAYREELHTRRNRFITERSGEFADADADEVAELLAGAKRKR